MLLLKEVPIMTKVVVDKNLRGKLHDLAESLEFCDESGETLGFFQPAGRPDAADYAWAKATVTDDELNRASQETELFTTAEVLAHLENL
jgi:hypothetical protein